jgi:hypothetical protein
MKPFLTTLLLATLCAATGYGQTVKSLGYNTTNGQVVYAGTNALTFTNSLGFTTNAAAATRTNLGLGATWLTNTNVTNFRSAIGAGTVNEGGEPSFQTVDLNDGEDNLNLSANAGITRTNLGLGGGVITNIDVLVSGGGTNTLQFSNGILTNVTTP